jgi:hypothetical protein
MMIPSSNHCEYSTTRRREDGKHPLVSLELPENVTEIECQAFYICFCLQNVAFPPNAVAEDEIFIGTGIQTDTDLYQLFGSNARTIRELQYRFD